MNQLENFGFKEKKILDFGTKVFIIFAVVVFSLYLLTINMISFVIVDGSSMENTFFDGDIVVENTFLSPKRGDVVIIKTTKQDYFSGEEVSQLIIKRIIAVEGDELYFYNGKVWLKESGQTEFKALQEEYTKSPASTFYPDVANENSYHQSEIIKIEKGCYYFLGDNRKNSHDSRSNDYGCCKASDITGVVTNFAINNKEATKALFLFSQKVYEFLGFN